MRAVLLLAASLSLCAQTPQQRAWSDQGKQLMAGGKFAEAVPVYEKLVQSAPTIPGLRLNLGMALHMAGRDKEAIPQLEQVTKAMPSAFPAWIMLGGSLMRMGQPARALPILQKAAQLNPEDTQARRVLADAYLMLAEPAKAVPHLEALTKIDPGQPAIWYALGRAEEELSRGHFARLLKAAPESSWMLATLAEAREKQGRQAAAAELKARAAKATPRITACPASQVKTPKAYYCAIRDHDARARTAFAKLAALGDSVEWRQMRAEILRNQNKPAESIAEWRAALKLAPSRPDLEQELAATLYANSEFTEARAILSRLMQAEPHRAELQFLMGDALLREGDAQRALPYLAQAHKLDAAHPPIRASLGRALLSLERAPEAIPHLEAVSAYDEDGSIHLQLSRAYSATGAKDKSEQARARGRALAAEHEAATQ